jgi:hypothetical protein
MLNVTNPKDMQIAKELLTHASLILFKLVHTPKYCNIGATLAQKWNNLVLKKFDIWIFMDFSAR